MNNIETIRDAFVIAIGSIVRAESLFENAYWSAKDIANQITFEYIKMDYHNSAPTKSIRQYLGCTDDDSQRRQYVRLMEYVQYYRDVENNYIEQCFGERISEYERKNMDTIAAKLAGRQLNAVQFRELTSIHEVRLFLKLLKHQIDDKKKVTDVQMVLLFNEYLKYLNELQNSATTPLQIIESIIELYQIEHHYCIHVIYELAVAMEKMKNKVSIPIKRISSITSRQLANNFILYPGRLTELNSNMLLHRHKVVSDIFMCSDAEWAAKELFISMSLHIKELFVKSRSQSTILENIHNTTLEEKAEFIRNDYWLWNCIPTFEWNKKRFTNFREVHSAITTHIENPKIR